MNNDINFSDYDKITDILMWLSDNITLNFVVSLNKTTKLGTKKFFHYETMYGVDKFTNNPNRSIKRNMNFYFVIDNRDNFANGLLLRPQDVYTLDMLITNEVLPWYFGTKEQLAFRIINKELKLAEYTPVTWAQSDIKYITFEPYVYEFEDGTSAQGIRWVLYSGDVILMSLDKFLGFLQLIRSDMYAIACANVTYAKTQPYGINVYDSRGLGGGRNAQQDSSEWRSKQDTGATTQSFMNNLRSK